MRVVSVVEFPLQFLKIAVQVLPAHLVKGADNGTLEQAPHALDPVGVDITDNPLLIRMTYRLVLGVMIFNPEVRPQLIGVDGLSLILDRAPDEVVEGITADIGDSLNSNPTATLDGTSHPRLVAFVSVTLAFGSSAYQRLVHFHDTQERGTCEGIVSHGLTDAVAQIPSGLVGDSQSSVELIGAHALFGFAHQVDRQKPLTQWKVGIVHDGSRRDAELIAA